MTGTKVTRGFGGNSPPKSPVVALETEVSSPDMEGPIALIAPELPEDTLMDVRKQACLLQHFSRQISELPCAEYSCKTFHMKTSLICFDTEVKATRKCNITCSL